MATSVPVPPPNSIFWKHPELCSYDTCPVEIFGQLQYIPNLGGNALFLAIFSLGLLVQIGLAIRYRTWGYLVAMIGGCGLEIVGYAGRLLLNNNVFDKNAFIVYLVGCTIGPACYSAAIYLCLSRIIAVYGFEASRLNPRMMTIFFITGDFISLVLQAAGGALASTGVTKVQVDRGVNIMIAGLSTQVVFTAVFTVLCGLMAFFIMRSKNLLNTETVKLRNSAKFKIFLVVIAAATILILERCAYRVAELSKGFGSALANDEVLFMVLDGAAMSLVIILLTVFHPGFILGRELWAKGAFRHLSKAKRSQHTTRTKIEADDSEMSR